MTPKNVNNTPVLRNIPFDQLRLIDYENEVEMGYFQGFTVTPKNGRKLALQDESSVNMMLEYGFSRLDKKSINHYKWLSINQMRIDLYYVDSYFYDNSSFHKLLSKISNIIQKILHYISLGICFNDKSKYEVYCNDYQHFINIDQSFRDKITEFESELNAARDNKDLSKQMKAKAKTILLVTSHLYSFLFGPENSDAKIDAQMKDVFNSYLLLRKEKNINMFSELTEIDLTRFFDEYGNRLYNPNDDEILLSILVTYLENNPECLEYIKI